jgi:2-C-methyl-D-erythritol 4-phosphate cytidylyltransferase
MGGGTNKVFLDLADGSVLSSSLRALQKSSRIDAVYTVVRPEDMEHVTREIESAGASKAVGRLVQGGEERFHSVLNGVEAMAAGGPPEYVLIHDGARPFLTTDMIRTTIEAAERAGAAVIGHPMVDTAKEVEEGEPYPRSLRTLDRTRIWQVQTPQTFRFSLILNAYREWDDSQGVPTDDTALVEALGKPVFLVPGPRYNIKITTEADLRIARAMVTEGIWQPS